MNSLRSRLIFWAGTATVCVLLFAGIALFMLIRKAVISEFDKGLTTQVQVLASEVEVGENGHYLDFDNGALPFFEKGRNAKYFELWDANGKVLQRSASLGNKDLSRLAKSSENLKSRAVMLPDGNSGRQVTLVFRLRGESPSAHSDRILTLSLAQKTEGIEDVMESIFWLLLGIGVLTTLVCLAVFAVIVRRGMRPIDQLGADIRAIRENQLSSRLANRDLPEELQPIVSGLNHLLERVEKAFDRERAFTANLAHELRTLLYGLRMKQDVVLMRPREGDAYRRALNECLSITIATQSMMENLLALARLDAGQITLKKEPVPLDEFLKEVWIAFDERAAERDLETVWDVAEVKVETDRERLRLILNNLFDNAVSYANPKDEVRIQTGTDDDGAWMKICNTGCELSAEAASRVFERFWRGDEARTDVGSHCGLGLSLSQRLAELLGCEITAFVEPEDWFCVRLRFLKSED